MSNEVNRRKVFFVTGANSGVGLEATRQLHNEYDSNNAQIYMLCRSEERAKTAMKSILGEDNNNNSDNLLFLQWDAFSSDTTTIPEEVDFVDGLILNAGGFGDDPKFIEKKQGGTDGQPSPSPQAQLNLLGHAALVKKLLAQNKIGKGTRIVTSGSEGCFAPPAPPFQWATCDLDQHLTSQLDGPGGSYTWLKGLVALYWAAFARRHPDLFVVTVSPGAMKGTQLFQHGGATGMLRVLSGMFIWGMGSNTVEIGASRYLDALLSRGIFAAADSKIKSGSFLAHRKGYNRDFGDVTQHKQGQDFGNESIQDRIWDAVEALV